MSDPPQENRDESGRSDPARGELSGQAMRLLELARKDAPSSELDEHVLRSISYRTRLLEAEARPAWWTSGRALGVAGGLALAASVLLWLSRGPEPAVEAGGSSPLELAREPIESPSAQVPTAIELPAAKSTQAPPAPAPEDPCRNVLVAQGTEPVIDDFEDGDDAILPFEHREGLWRWVRDTDAPGTAPALLPVPRFGRTAKNQLALHVKGGRLREWGATVEFVFGNRCYDASAYAGIAFSARGSTRIYVAPREVSVMPVSEGGTCVEDCHNNHVKQIRLEPAWHTYQVRFDEVEQRGYDRPRLDPKRLHSIAFLIRPEDTPYDVWIDDVRFIER
jgi:hypothetical protein